jgi:hypothetical protein
MSSYGVKVDVRNNRLPELIARLPEEVNDVALAGARVGVKVAKSRVAILTGALKASIHIEGHGSKLQIVSDRDYAAVAEFGGVNRPARPALRPGAMAAMLDIKKGLSKLAGRLESQ